MAERNLNFDEIVERRGTDCLKYDFAKRRGKPADVLPLWVADMDFKTSSYVEDALIERAKHGIFGYSDTQEVYFNAVAGWMERHHHWKIKEDSHLRIRVHSRTILKRPRQSGHGEYGMALCCIF